MTYLVPYDDSDLSRAALDRADEFGAAMGESVVAVTVVPNENEAYARSHGWLADDEAYDQEAVLERLRQRVREGSPSARFQHEFVDRYAPSGTISNRVRTVARRLDVSMVFVGSRNAGHFVSSISSIGTGVAAAEHYDVLIVRTGE
ncbi:MAG: universal stress protein [Haloferacaceae archaeon]